jgi:selenocysteine lyase/cysteine desulfurase
VEDAEGAAARLRDAGVVCSARGGSVRLSFHLYNDEEDVALAAGALRPSGLVESGT